MSSSTASTKEDQQNMASCRAVRRIHNAFSRKTNNPNVSDHYSQETTQRLVLHGSVFGPEEAAANVKDVSEADELVSKVEISSTSSGRERLKRHREEMGGHVSIPDKWGQEELLKDWIDCSSFEALLVPNKIASARKALVADHGRTSPASSTHQLRIESRC